MIAFTANSRCAHALSSEIITSGSIGIPVEYSLSPDFDGLQAVMVFQGSGASIDVILPASVVVPPEVVAASGGSLKIGVYARNQEGTIAIPTVWACAGFIEKGCEPSDIDPSEPTPDWTAQVQAVANEALAHIENLTVSASGLPAGSAPTASWDADTDVLSLGIPKGDKGDNGADGQTGATPDIFTTAVTLSPGSTAYAHTSGTLEQPLITFGIPRGADGQDGQDGAPGVGVPTGGTTGQVLAKKSGTDYDTEWVNQSGGGGGAVDSVNGKTGTVVLDADDVGALPDDTVIPSAATATPADLGTAAVGSSTKYAKEDHVHNKPTYSKSDVGLGNVDNVQQYSATNPPPYPVTSVNSQTGAVTVSVPSASSATPQALGTATAGTSSDFSRADHVHAKPSASDVGAIATPSSPSVGDFLVYTSDGWDAVTLAEWTAGSY